MTLIPTMTLTLLFQFNAGGGGGGKGPTAHAEQLRQMLSQHMVSHVTGGHISFF